jgi:hypothetical protein
MQSKFLAPAFWIALMATVTMSISNWVGWTSISWWAVPYPMLVYLSVLAIRLVGTMAATQYVLRNGISSRGEATNS